MPRVLNKYRDEIPEDAVNIMRPSIWGNPFSHLEFAKHHMAMTWVPDREQAVREFESWLLNERPDLVKLAKRKLKGKDLVCCCKPAACHGDVLLEIANED